jgi:hypothetical protein
MAHTCHLPSCVGINWGQYTGQFGVLRGYHIATSSDSSSPPLPAYESASVLLDNGTTSISLPSNPLTELPRATCTATCKAIRETSPCLQIRRSAVMLERWYIWHSAPTSPPPQQLAPGAMPAPLPNNLHQPGDVLVDPIMLWVRAMRRAALR